MLPIPKQPVYNFKEDVFKQARKYMGFAENHKLLFELWRRSDVFSYEVAEAETKFNIPVVYRFHYKLKSIIGIDEQQMPVYGDHHICEVSIKGGYPIQSPTAFMKSDAWHPNIKFDGPKKGRVCVNAAGFGVTYTLDLLAMRIGEILQYKNYLAEFRKPYPEDERVAKWVREFAHPQEIFNREDGIYIDYSDLVRPDGSVKEVDKEPEKKIKITLKSTPTDKGPVSRIIIKKNKEE